jgi:hypothetical protein
VAELVYFAPRRRNAVVDLAVAPLYGWPVTLGRPLLVFRSAEAFLGSIIYARHFLAGLFMVAGVGALCSVSVPGLFKIAGLILGPTQIVLHGV